MLILEIHYFVLGNDLNVVDLNMEYKYLSNEFKNITICLFACFGHSTDVKRLKKNVINQ
jgi:hypothetical protein